jgi:cytochrome c-type biogenesis protein CcmE
VSDLDLTPRSGDPRSGSRTRNWIIGGLFVVIAGFVLYNALTSATVFFLNVDEAIDQQDELGDQVFRIQGLMIDDPVTGADNAIVFNLAFNGEQAEIHHIGDEPSSLFETGQPIVAEGRWRGDYFESTLITVKHSEEYVEDNPDRVDYELDTDVS